jgi:hypothetical protein
MRERIAALPDGEVGGFRLLKDDVLVLQSAGERFGFTFAAHAVGDAKGSARPAPCLDNKNAATKRLVSSPKYSESRRFHRFMPGISWN